VDDRRCYRKVKLRVKLPPHEGMVIAANAPREAHARGAAVTGGPIISCANGGILAGLARLLSDNATSKA